MGGKESIVKNLQIKPDTPENSGPEQHSSNCNLTISGLNSPFSFIDTPRIYSKYSPDSSPNDGLTSQPRSKLDKPLFKTGLHCTPISHNCQRSGRFQQLTRIPVQTNTGSSNSLKGQPSLSVTQQPSINFSPTIFMYWQIARNQT